MVVGTVKVIILGAYGMLGYDLQHVFPDAVFYGKELDITCKEKVVKTILSGKPDVVINAAAYTDVDGCEDNADHAFRVNGEGLLNIVEACHKTSTRLVHYSTDYVFDGTKEEYLESDTPNPINIYGRSKMFGEQKIQENMLNYLIIRTSWLFGTKGANFVDTMLKLSGQMDEVKVVDDQFGKPTYTMDLAKKTKDIIDMESGIYHLTNEGVCSWYEFASAIIPNVVPCSSEEFIRKAKRPKYSVLKNTKTQPMRHWREALNDYLEVRKI